ncbi:hypothetical protein SAMN04488109_3330 [Chryseolinea serpens]|uniref:Uncharacterized protein n=1 Tax=Chryseolinea serpens TaxID=947013 RepID=A0A1M5RDH3_9BACT|nr:hypothetical protein [Chryseolinea serpens]SHH24248.1 hypothetical protein SAMN04488109_3330 [Chryseolinea serpens]
MSTQHDIERKASLFTMNGLVDPRWMPDTVAHEATSRPNASRPDALSVWRAFVQRLFSGMSKGNAGL